MAKTWAKAPSPCIDVCKFRDAGRCVGCAMTKPEKKAFKRIGRKSKKQAFFLMLEERLVTMGKLGYWTRMYRRKCERKDASCPLDRLEKLDRAA
ncbi:hypothetical protein Sa4125_36420 [Aureimonas sp. SA4125]|uniref:DUF1289 domain-containing protein n=1 Tax=Aureimonas sp. SA4125 TaxID=2826993 RepID=UPI001CC5CC34|nr:DUF1289 domain-containing protein [Aureimonas sp. SA4125]BDA86100.1 hypothetical protein Sa4125_36420 [Aureimonas sp. SA4125]